MPSEVDTTKMRASATDNANFIHNFPESEIHALCDALDAARARIRELERPAQWRDTEADGDEAWSDDARDYLNEIGGDGIYCFEPSRHYPIEFYKAVPVKDANGKWMAPHVLGPFHSREEAEAATP